MPSVTNSTAIAAAEAVTAAVAAAEAVTAAVAAATGAAESSSTAAAAAAAAAASASAAAAAAASASTPVEEPVRQLGRQLVYVLLAAAGLGPLVGVSRDLSRRFSRSAVDHALLTRLRIALVLMTLSNLWSVLIEHADTWPTELRRASCLLETIISINGVGLVSVCNCLVSLCRLQQVAAARIPAISACVTQRRLRWQNSVLIAVAGFGFCVAPCFGLYSNSYFWCTGESTPQHSPPRILFAINSSINTSNFIFCVVLLRASSGLRSTLRPHNYIPSDSWAQLGLFTILADTLLVPINTSALPASHKVLLNHVHITLLHGVLDPCLLLALAGRWRQQVRDCRQQLANRPYQTPPSTIPEIRLDLI